MKRLVSRSRAATVLSSLLGVGALLLSMCGPDPPTTPRQTRESPPTLPATDRPALEVFFEATGGDTWR
ncbi:MAG: hypothetical protein F4Y04_02940 [Chloroflexi bacterium]|nr:hypothetical protein [Chloroflexota bacterium]